MITIYILYVAAVSALTVMFGILLLFQFAGASWFRLLIGIIVTLIVFLYCHYKPFFK